MAGNKDNRNQFQNLSEALQKTFITIRDGLNNYVQKIICAPDLQIGMRDKKFPSKGIIFHPKDAPVPVTNKLYHTPAGLSFDGNLLVSESNGIISTQATVGIGTEDPGYLLTVETNTAFEAEVGITQYNDTSSGDGGNIRFNRSRGVSSDRSSVQDGDNLGSIHWYGYATDTWPEAASIWCESDGTPGSNDMPGRLLFYTTPDGSSTRVERMRMDNAGGVDIVNQNTFRRSSGRYYLEEFFSKRPQINATIAGTWNTAATRACNQLFELQGTGKIDAGVDWGGNTAGLLLTTGGGGDKQQIIAPHADQGADSQYDSAWRGVHWGTENQVEWETAIMTAGSIAEHGFWAGLKQSNTSTIATDDDQAYFTYCADDTFGTLADNANWHFVYSVADTDYITDLGLAVATETIYRFRISIDSSRQVSVFINDTQYGLTQTGGTTGTVESDSRQKSAALTDDENFIPYAGVQTLGTGVAYMYLFYEKISRILSE